MPDSRPAASASPRAAVPAGRAGDAVPPSDPRFYDAEYYARNLHARHWFRNNDAKFRARWDNALRLLDPRRDDVVLELGCAAGEHTLRLAPLVARAVGLDFSPDAVRLAREAAAAQGSRAEFVEGDVRDLSAFADASVDKVLALDLVEHVEDGVLRDMLRECHRVLRPGGRLVVYTPSATHYVERMKSRNLVLRQLPGHVAVRGGAAYGALLADMGGDRAWSSLRIEYLPSDYPVFGWLDRALMRLPWLGAWFRFRILLLAVR